MQSFISNTKPISQSKNLILKPTYADIDSAVIWMVNRDLPIRLPDLTANVKHWLQILFDVCHRIK